MVNLSFRNDTIYEIYPESETPQLTQVAHLDRIDLDLNPHFKLLPGIVIWYRSYNDRVLFTVWDYRLNYSISFSVDVDDRLDFRVYFLFFPKNSKIGF